MELLLITGVLLFVIIAAADVLGPRLGLAAPLLLVLVGVGLSLIPATHGVEVDPEIILQGILPLLLYAAAVSMPTMSFRRDFGAISGLSVVLVIITSLLLGLLFQWLIPDLGFAWGVALGAIVSPTDAVATSIIKGGPVPRRVVVLLEGEGLLNDATALVMLRTAIVASAAGFSFWGVVGSLAYSVTLAAVVGSVVGVANLAVRRRVEDPTVNTILSFTVPFLASIPTEAAGASGLVAAVVAGLVTGVRAPRQLSPRHRLSDRQNWESINLIGEGAVFLAMGFQLGPILEEVSEESVGLGVLVGIAAAALAATLLIRAAFVAPLLWQLRRKALRREAMRPRAEAIQGRLADPQAREEAVRRFREQQAQGGVARARARHHRKRWLGTRRGAPDLERFSARLRRFIADTDYLTKRPLSAADGGIVVWAGMRGAVTVAAAQTLPEDTPMRSVLIFIAFAVAALSLAVQGGTIKPLADRLSRRGADPESAQEDREEQRQEHRAVMALLHEAARAPEGEAEPSSPAEAKRVRLASIRRQRAALLDARDEGTYDADVLDGALQVLDADEISLQLRGGAAF
ncbi:cation:proton antiporter [Rothia kristinae]|uniref:Cation:proton antiporter n=1 Tax=Rothia kristinae TaxID=37923 RepID=A0A7T3CI18_9MICC|nr:cation:proton antiporter [Rothia kristinae]KTR38421.1 solute:hydrogen antiporter [Rothia kristinae]KTR56096.1 solute:hydrogen antiporter [Rothia kristinae]KTR73140.1 solute:hydrogen antiporter [Rothia kristinae]KTR73733.1 solute:hydrogen antiporter [Rothia kristinae]KTR80350.1 solute:hydrogen antiporter [Rothia kristinae]